MQSKMKENKLKDERLKKLENSLLERHKVNQNVARNLLMNKPVYNIGNKNEQMEHRSNTNVFDHKQLIKQAQTGDFKEKLFNRDLENESRRDIASEIDYSDHKSINTTITLQKRSSNFRQSDTQSVLSKGNLDKLNKEMKDDKIIRKCNIFSYSYLL